MTHQNLRLGKCWKLFRATLNGFELEVVKSEKDLGVMIANDTSRKENIVTIVGKANKMMGFLKRNCAGLVDSEALLRLYSS